MHLRNIVIIFDYLFLKNAFSNIMVYFERSGKIYTNNASVDLIGI